MEQLATKRKFPRIGHLPYSPGKSLDDIWAEFNATNIVITEKYDGENTTFMQNCFYARSIDSGGAPWRSMIAALHSRICCMIPPNMRICGENMQAKHSIYYELDFPFYVFMIFEDDKILSWEDTKVYCEILGLPTVPELFKGTFQEFRILRYNSLEWRMQEGELRTDCEGYVIRNSEEFLEENFHTNVAKFVRKGHVQTDEHWTKNWKPNGVNLK